MTDYKVIKNKFQEIINQNFYSGSLKVVHNSQLDIASEFCIQSLKNDNNLKSITSISQKTPLGIIASRGAKIKNLKNDILKHAKKDGDLNYKIKQELKIIENKKNEEKKILEQYKNHRDLNYKIKNEIAKRNLAYVRAYNCGYKPLSNVVQFQENPVFGNISVAGVETCGSIWVCPNCKDKSLPKRQIQIQRAIDGNAHEGGTSYLITFTAPHSRTDSLKDFFGNSKAFTGISGAFYHMRKHGSFRRIKARNNYLADCRAIETTFGLTNFWHAHIHMIFFAKAALTDEQIKKLEDDLFKLWKRMCLKAGLNAPNREHGVDITNGVNAGKYIAKWGSPSELTSHAFKKAKNGNFTIAQLEMLLLENDESVITDKQLNWILRSYYTTMKGRRLLTWAGDKEFREKYIGKIDKTDEELAAEEDVEVNVVAECSSKLWKEIYKKEAVSTALSIFELWGFEAFKSYVRDTLKLDDSSLIRIDKKIQIRGSPNTS